MSRALLIGLSLLALVGCADEKIANQPWPVPPAEQRQPERKISAWLYAVCDVPTGNLLYIYTGQAVAVVPGGCKAEEK